MIPKNLVQKIESHAEQITQDILERVRRDPRTASYGDLPDSELRQAVTTVLKNLGEWISSRRPSAIENFYRKVGARRRHSGIRISEMLAAFGLAKRSLQEFIHRSVQATPEEAALESELILAVDEFFDSACYGGALGYEDADRAATEEREPAPTVGEEYVEKAQATTVSSQDWDPTSRAGEVGEHGG